jgi:hypothetical protein
LICRRVNTTQNVKPSEVSTARVGQQHYRNTSRFGR